MIIKTEAICIKNTRYGDSSIISKMFSLEYGLCAFLAQGVHRKSNAIRPSHLSPGNIIEMVIYQKPNASMQRIKEVKMVSQLLSVHTDMRKNAVLQFMLEIIAKTNEELHKDEIIYQFLKNALIQLENQSQLLGLIPLHFLSEYLKFSGWFPDLDLWEEGKVFRMEDGRFEFPSQEISNKELSLELSQLMYLVFSSRVLEDERIISSKNRKDLFNSLLLYFEIHLMKGKKIKSPEILAEILA